MGRRIIITRNNTENGFPYERPKRKVTRLTERQKWRKNLGKRGQFEFKATIVEDDISKSKPIFCDSWDEACQWADFVCRPGQIIYIDDQEIIRRN
tara:strand:- start:18 stop:302 length:285 start_codon:yes stop_codon:yes gene_type:complete